MTPDLQIDTYDIQPGATIRVPRIADFFFFETIQPTGERIEVRIDSEGSFNAFGQARGWRMPGVEPFELLELHNPTAQALTVQLVTGSGEYISRGSQITNVPAVVQRPRTNLNAGGDSTVSAGSTATVTPADSGREMVHVKVPISAPGPVRVGGSGGIGPSQGIELGPGDSWSIRTTDEIQVHNPQTSGIAIQVAEEFP